MTIKEVAALAGVSPAAVSRYLNGGSISTEKRERVKRAIAETGYRPNPMAQTMRTGRTNQIGIIVPRIYSDSVSQITAGAAHRLSGRGFMTVLGCTDQDSRTELDYLEILQENQVSGILLMGTRYTPQLARAIRDCRVPVVVTGQNFEGFFCVCHDDFHAVRDLARLLIARGRRKIAMISAPADDVAAGLERRRGAQEALAEAGLDPGAMPWEQSAFDAKGGRRAMERLLEREPGLDGVLCATDTMALGAMAALRAAGRRIPEDVSIAGVGDSWADSVAVPSLTTAHLYFRQCGEEAAKLLLGLIDGEKDGGSPCMIRLPYLIVERESV